MVLSVSNWHSIVVRPLNPPRSLNTILTWAEVRPERPTVRRQLSVYGVARKSPTSGSSSPSRYRPSGPVRMPFTPPEWRIDVVGRRRLCTKGLRHQSTLSGDRSMHCRRCARLSGDQCGELCVPLGTADAEVLTMLFHLVPVRPYDLRPTTVWPSIGMRPCLRHPNAQNINVGVVSLVAFTGSGADTNVWIVPFGVKV